MTEDAVWDALAQVIDPELGLDVVELGLIYDVALRGDAVAVRMTLTTAGCPLHDVIVGGVERAVTAAGASAVDVEVVFDPPWDPDRIGAAGRDRLGAP
jgi:metal-sulfur cluster biosynthetic enzyme